MFIEMLDEFVFNLHHGSILMPTLSYAVAAWVLRLVLIIVACFLWYLSIKGFRKSKWLIPGFFNLFAYMLMFIACFEVDFIIYQCESMRCLSTRREVHYGIIGVCTFKKNEECSRCTCNESERQPWKAAEVRFWGGFIGFLPSHVEIIHKLAFTCPCCGSVIGDYTLPKCANCSDDLNGDDLNDIENPHT